MDQIAIRMDALGPMDSDPVIAAIAYAHVKDGQVVEVRHIAITLDGQAPRKIHPRYFSWWVNQTGELRKIFNTAGNRLDTVIHQIETLCKTTQATVFMTRETQRALLFHVGSQDLHETMNAIGLGDHIVFNHDLDCRLAVEADAATLCGLHSLKESHGNKA